MTDWLNKLQELPPPAPPAEPEPPLGDSRHLAADAIARVERLVGVLLAREQVGGLDVVVNNAGVEITSLVVDLDPAQVRKMLEINVLGLSADGGRTVRIATRIDRGAGAAGRSGRSRRT